MTAATATRKARAANGLKTQPVPAMTADDLDFMKGKALAAALLLESMGDGADTWANLCADYRAPGEAQNNYAERYLRQIIACPELLLGFSAGLSSGIAECREKLEGNAESVATISLDACRTRATFNESNPRNHYSEPALPEQLANYGLAEFIAPPARAETTVATKPAAAGIAASEASPAAFASNVTGAEPDAWSPCAFACEIILAEAQKGDDPLTWAFHRVIEAAKDAISECDKPQHDDPLCAGVAYDILNEALELACFLRKNRDCFMDGAAALLINVALQEHQAFMAAQEVRT